MAVDNSSKKPVRAQMGSRAQQQINRQQKSAIVNSMCVSHGYSLEVGLIILVIIKKGLFEGEKMMLHSLKILELTVGRLDLLFGVDEKFVDFVMRPMTVLSETGDILSCNYAFQLKFNLQKIF